MRQATGGKQPNGAARFTLDLIRGRWKIPILRELMSGPRRTGQLVRALRGVSKNRLNDSLRKLERAGLIRRSSRAGRKPRVENELTRLGRTLRPVVEALSRWGSKNRLKVESARVSGPRGKS